MDKKRLTPTSTLPDICLHLNGVAPAPRKDFFDLKVSLKQRKVSLVKWIITSRQEGGKFRPTEMIDSFEDFPSEMMKRYIPFVFGKDIVRHIQGIIDGNFDWLVRLPDDLLIYLLTFLNLEDVERLSQVCTRLKLVCTSDALWKELFYLHMPSVVSSEVDSLAVENGWKTVFYSSIFERKLRAKHLLQSQSSEASTPRAASSAASTSRDSASSAAPTPRTPADDTESLASWQPSLMDDSEELEELELESVVG